MRGTKREAEIHRQSEKHAPHGEPDVGFDPGTLGSWPEPKADAQPLSHQGTPTGFFVVVVQQMSVLSSLPGFLIGGVLCVPYEDHL